MPRVASSHANSRKAAPRPDDHVSDRPVRDLLPLDGSIAQCGENVSVFCATCERWIDCCEGVPADVARSRHGDLFH
jgi:hypothetical protein